MLRLHLDSVSQTRSTRLAGLPVTRRVPRRQSESRHERALNDELWSAMICHQPCPSKRGNLRRSLIQVSARHTLRAVRLPRIGPHRSTGRPTDRTPNIYDFPRCGPDVASNADQPVLAGDCLNRAGRLRRVDPSCLCRPVSQQEWKAGRGSCGRVLIASATSASLIAGQDAASSSLSAPRRR